MKIILPLRILTALIFVAFAVSMMAQEVSIPDPASMPQFGTHCKNQLAH
jgi:hypothetical protein